jgi:hypothetical protein
MADSRFLPGFVLVAFVAAAVLASLIVIGLSRPAASRAGLVAGGLPLALLTPVAAAGYVSTFNLFGSANDFAPGGHVAASLWLIQGIAWAAFAAACLVGLTLALLPSSEATAAASCSLRRSLVLVLLPCLGLLVAAALTNRVAKGMRVVVAVFSSDASDPESYERTGKLLEAEGLPTGGSGSLGAAARFVGRSSIVGVFGGATVAIVLLGLALPGFILAWRIRFGSAFRAIACAAWLLAAAGGSLAALGALTPLRFP